MQYITDNINTSTIVRPTHLLISYADWLELCRLLDLEPEMTMVEVLERVTSLVCACPAHEK